MQDIEILRYKRTLGKRKGKNDRPMVTQNMAVGLRMLSQLVNASHSTEIYKAAKYVYKLSLYLESDAFEVAKQARMRRKEAHVKRKKEEIYE